MLSSRLHSNGHKSGNLNNSNITINCRKKIVTLEAFIPSRIFAVVFGYLEQGIGYIVTEFKILKRDLPGKHDRKRIGIGKQK